MVRTEFTKPQSLSECDIQPSPKALLITLGANEIGRRIPSTPLAVFCSLNQGIRLVYASVLSAACYHPYVSGEQKEQQTNESERTGGVQRQKRTPPKGLTGLQLSASR